MITSTLSNVYYLPSVTTTGDEDYFINKVLDQNTIFKVQYFKTLWFMLQFKYLKNIWFLIVQIFLNPKLFTYK